jgi:hypothetical protein
MIRAVLTWLTRRYQRHLGVETPYMDEVVEHAPGALLPLVGFIPASLYGRPLPTRVLHMVRLGATLSRECGTCLEIGTTLALRDGVPARLVEAAVRGAPEELGDELRLGLRFGERLGGGLEVHAEREEIRRRYGPRGVIAASVAVAGSLTFPAVQRGMGYGGACRLEGAPPASPAARA